MAPTSGCIATNVQPIKNEFLRNNFETDDDLFEGTVTDFNDEWFVTFEIKSDGSTLGVDGGRCWKWRPTGYHTTLELEWPMITAR